MFNHKFSFGWSNGGGNALSRTITVSAGAEKNIEEAIPATTNDRLVNYDLDVSQALGLYMVADKDLVVETNAADHAAGNIFTLPAGKPFVWVQGMPPMRDTAGSAVVDITALYVTNAGDSDANLSIRTLVDPTI